MMKCDPVTGACLLPEQERPTDTTMLAARNDLAVRYIGDPMCSWCWGISPVVREVAAFCEAEGIEFSITVGGLRAGGGDPWTEGFKDFLRSEWRHIAQVTGQSFGFTLLDAAYFNYDTEPACRAVETVQLLQARHRLASSIVLSFFTQVQHKFYVEGGDPKATDFYAGICSRLGLDFEEFRMAFGSCAAKQAVEQAFMRCRQWGVRSFPTLLLERGAERLPLAAGYVPAEQVLSRLRRELLAPR
ncbi:DsbA family protein [Pseudomonas chlororaphis]|uniref:DsbA family protein n=1 Tax=Pseudomonas chlororaphis TaxID=587753 RepID=UPI000471EDC1|nr:DsbA family protein [Pseudomonas chlororaphis]